MRPNLKHDTYNRVLDAKYPTLNHYFAFVVNGTECFSIATSLYIIGSIKNARLQHIDKKMEHSKKQLRTCPKGHQFYKSSNCPTCPICEQERKPKDNFLSLLVAPARRALENRGITTLHQLSNFTEEEILQLHGIGPSTMPKLRKALKENGLNFKHN